MKHLLILLVSITFFLSCGSSENAEGMPLYIITYENGEINHELVYVDSEYSTKMSDGEEIIIKEEKNKCAVLNLSDSDLYLYPECYGDCGSDWGEEYVIEPESIVYCNIDKIDILPGDEIPDEISSEESSVTFYVLYSY